MQKKYLLAIEAVLYVACRSGTDPVSLKDICKSEGVAERYLEQVMQKLVHKGILKGIRGPKGGYLLARERRKIYLREIYEIASEAECAKDNAKWQSMSNLGKKVIKPIEDTINEGVSEILGNITIGDLFDKVKEVGLEKEFIKNSDFNI